MCAYSVDLRERVLAAVERGMPRHEVGLTFNVSLATIKRWLAQWRANNDITPKAPPGRRRMITPAQYAALATQLETNHDATLERHTQLWNASQGMPVSQWTMGRAIRRLGWTYKKRRWERPIGMNTPGLPSGSASSSATSTIA